MNKKFGIVATFAATALVLGGCAAEGEEGPAEEITSESSAESVPDTTLKLGYLLPQTGDLDFIGFPMIAGVELAVNEINAAGGVLGNDVELFGADGGVGTDRANEEVARLLDSGVQGIIGAASSNTTLAVIDTITGAGVPQCSPSASDNLFLTYPDNGYFFRTVPSGVVQGPVIADLIVEAGYSTVAIAARDDDYGVPLKDATLASLHNRGVEVLATGTYGDTNDGSPDIRDDLAIQEVDAFVVLSFEEGAEMIQSLLDAGIEPARIFGADGISGSAFADNFASPEVLDGLRITSPDFGVPAEFEARLLAFNPDLLDLLFAPNAYDCVNVMALAASFSESTNPSSIRDNMIAVTNGDNECTTYAECMEFIDQGASIAYQSARGGSLDFAAVREGGGDVLSGVVEVSAWQDGEFVLIDTRRGDLLTSRSG